MRGKIMNVILMKYAWGNGFALAFVKTCKFFFPVSIEGAVNENKRNDYDPVDRT